MIKNEIRHALPMSALDSIPESKQDAKTITALVKQQGRVIGYQLSDGQVVSKGSGVALAKSGDIAGVGIAHRGDTEYLKSLPDNSDANNLSSLPTVSADVFN